MILGPCKINWISKILRTKSSRRRSIFLPMKLLSWSGRMTVCSTNWKTANITARTITGNLLDWAKNHIHQWVQPETSHMSFWIHIRHHLAGRIICLWSRPKVRRKNRKWQIPGVFTSWCISTAAINTSLCSQRSTRIRALFSYTPKVQQVTSWRIWASPEAASRTQRIRSTFRRKGESQRRGDEECCRCDIIYI